MKKENSLEREVKTVEERRATGGGQEPNALVQNFLRAMEQRNQGNQPQEKLFTTLADLLTPASTIPLLDTADDELVDRLFEYLPEQLVKMVQPSVDTMTGEQRAAPHAKKDILRRVLHSPQFSQSLSSLTIALREGGLPIISETFKIPVRNGGYLRHGGVPMGGGEAVEAFMEGIKKDVQDKLSKRDDAGGDRMEED